MNHETVCELVNNLRTLENTLTNAMPEWRSLRKSMVKAEAESDIDAPETSLGSVLRAAQVEIRQLHNDLEKLARENGIDIPGDDDPGVIVPLSGGVK